MNRIPIVECPTHVGHAPAIEVQNGRSLTAYDQVLRIERISEQLYRLPQVERRQPANHGIAPVLRVHDEGMVRFLDSVWVDAAASRPPGAMLLFADTFFHSGLNSYMRPNAFADAEPLVKMGLYCFDTITGVGPLSATAAFGAVDTALTGVHLLASGKSQLVVALCRPPGHHVGRRIFGGGCFLNNAAIAAQKLRDDGADRVAILDIDYHHGNGTQDVFYSDPSVLYVSLHGDPQRTFPYFTGYANERGVNDGAGYNLNIPLPTRIGVDDYRRHLQRGLDAIADFAPRYLVLSLGLDSMDGDPAGDGMLLPEDLEQVGRDIAGLSVPMLAVLEGGYRLDTLGAGFTRTIAGLAAAPGGDTDRT